MKRVEVPGNMQILDFYDINMLVKDYNENTIYFMNQSGNRVSDKYLDIYVYDNGYIVKKTNGKYTLINKKFKQIINKEFDYINPKFIDYGFLICANLPKSITFNKNGMPTNITYSLMDMSGNVYSGGYTNIYNIIEKKSEELPINDYLYNLTNIEYNFIGEEFYNK